MVGPFAFLSPPVPSRSAPEATDFQRGVFFGTLSQRLSQRLCSSHRRLTTGCISASATRRSSSSARTGSRSPAWVPRRGDGRRGRPDHGRDLWTARNGLLRACGSRAVRLVLGGTPPCGAGSSGGRRRLQPALRIRGGRPRGGPSSLVVTSARLRSALRRRSTSSSSGILAGRARAGLHHAFN